MTPQPIAAVSQGWAATQSQNPPPAATGAAVPVPTITVFVPVGAGTAPLPVTGAASGTIDGDGTFSVAMRRLTERTSATRRPHPLPNTGQVFNRLRKARRSSFMAMTIAFGSRLAA